MKNFFALVFTVILLICRPCVNVFAFNTYGDNRYILVGGITNKYYYSDATGNWKDTFKNGIKSWNDSSTPFKFSETKNISESKIDCYVYYDPTDNALAYAALYISGRGLTRTVPNSNWQWATVNFNRCRLKDEVSSYNNGVAVHEIGHTIGLNHSTSTSKTVMSAGYTGNYTTPQTDDTDGVNVLYLEYK